MKEQLRILKSDVKGFAKLVLVEKVLATRRNFKCILCGDPLFTKRYPDTLEHYHYGYWCNFCGLLMSLNEYMEVIAVDLTIPRDVHNRIFRIEYEGRYGKSPDFPIHENIEEHIAWEESVDHFGRQTRMLKEKEESETWSADNADLKVDIVEAQRLMSEEIG